MRRKNAHDEKTAEPWDIFVERFRDGALGLERAIANGSVQTFETDGVKFCAYWTIKVGTTKSIELRERIKQACNESLCIES